jgi:hypothetical protein
MGRTRLFCQYMICALLCQIKEVRGGDKAAAPTPTVEATLEGVSPTVIDCRGERDPPTRSDSRATCGCVADGAIYAAP